MTTTTNLRIKAIDDGYRIIGDDNNGQAVVADWTTYATESEARDALDNLAEAMTSDAMAARQDAMADLRRYADDLGVIVGEFRANHDGTIEICGVDGTDETVADVEAARRWLRECAE